MPRPLHWGTSPLLERRARPRRGRSQDRHITNGYVPRQRDMLVESFGLEILQAMEKRLKTWVLSVQLFHPVDGMQRVLFEAATRLVWGDGDGLQLLRELRRDALGQHCAEEPFIAQRELKMVLGVPDPQVGRLLQEYGS